jgi:chorismate dehydratase
MLRIGQISYANCTPIFWGLTHYFNCSDCTFVPGVPAQLNRLLRAGELDLCPSSSVEYALAADRYLLLPDLSISSDGPVRSVLLLSRVPLAELQGKVIGLTTESETSVILLRVLLARFHGLDCTSERTSLSFPEVLNSYPAVLLIGDAALRAGSAAVGLQVYDLGELWHQATGLPFVFALWIVNRSAFATHGPEVAVLAGRLRAARDRAQDSYPEIAERSKELAWLSRQEVVTYWRTISYDLSSRHCEGLRRFFQYAAEMGLLPAAPQLYFVTPGAANDRGNSLEEGPG